MADTHETENKIHAGIDNVASKAHGETSRVKSGIDDVKSGIDDFREKAAPKLEEAENFLTSPNALSFYQGIIVGAAIVLAYAKVNGGLRI